MKKKFVRSIAAAFAVMFCIGALSGCGGEKYSYDSASSQSFKTSSTNGAKPESYEYGLADEAETYYSSNTKTSGGENADYYENENTESSRKLIKRVSLTLETLEFDQSVGMIEEYVRRFNGYIESSNIHNNDYYTTYYNRNYSNRSASYVIRVPNNLIDQFVSSAGNIGNIISNSTSTEDITLGYLDVESRAKALKIQQERLLALLEEAKSVEEIISLEDRISQVTYELESRESTLRNYDNLVSYSTISIVLNEVQRISEPVPETVGERISSGFRETMYDITEGLKDFVVWFVVNLPYIIIFLLVLALATVIVIAIVKFFKKLGLKSYAKRQKKLQARQEAYAKQQAEMKARQEAEAKKQAELKAQKEAELKAQKEAEEKK